MQDELISRQAVLDIIEKEQFKGDAIEEIEKLPPVNPQPKTGHWIPVSERLPVEGGEYLITWTGVMDGFEKRSKPIISVTEYEIYEPDNYADWITNVSNDFEYYHDIKVTAWMPLPKPFSVDEPLDERVDE